MVAPPPMAPVHPPAELGTPSSAVAIVPVVLKRDMQVLVGNTEASEGSVQLLSSPAPPQTNHLIPAQPKQRSTWSSVLLDEVEKLRARPLSVTVAAGIAHTSIPEEILTNSMPLWTSYIVGHFIGEEAPHIGKVHATVNRLWTSPEKRTKIDAQFLNPKTVLFKVENTQIRSRVLRRHFWHISDIPMVVQEWNPHTANASPDLSTIPIWVDFSNVPDQLFSRKGLMFLGDVIGTSQKLHPNTERCTRLDVARVLMEVNFNGELPNQINLISDPHITIQVTYPWLPPRCHTCNSWGHKNKECSQMKKGSVLRKENMQKDDGQKQKQNQSMGVFAHEAESSDKRLDIMKDLVSFTSSIKSSETAGTVPAEIVDTEEACASEAGFEVEKQSKELPHTEVRDTEMLHHEREIPATISEDHGKDYQWTLISKNKSSPGKVSKPQESQPEELAIQSPSRFSVLTQSLDEQHEPEDGEIATDQSHLVSSDEGTEYPDPPRTRRGGGLTSKTQQKKSNTTRKASSKVPRPNNNNKSSSRKA